MIAVYSPNMALGDREGVIPYLTQRFRDGFCSRLGIVCSDSSYWRVCSMRERWLVLFGLGVENSQLGGVPIRILIFA